MYRRYRMPSVWRDKNRLQREMNHLFDASFTRRFRPAPGFPALNVWSNEDGLFLTAEVPGLNPEDIDITVVGETLTLSGKRELDKLNGGGKFHRRERGYGNFTRTIQLPFPVDADNVGATFTNGVLNITLPRKESDKPKKITVKAGKI